MSMEGEPEDSDAVEQVRALSPRQLEGFQYGVAAVLMPVSGGWRVHYFSIPAFDEEPGTTFPTFEAAINAVQAVLPAVNSEEERARARDELSDRGRQPPDSRR